ncbi:thiamine pyrophosphate-binding protein [Magnetovirga frankeli]|uniref:thiamine pyrophosphate-binding protein n=1 Tax=Magnetovirga frankeli TaxID=947516 RepID=UPI001292D019|nr:thiamine pyrophosphate-binding protein [gamma proteobacterium SS-5]
MNKQISVSQALVAFLQRLEVGCIFGMPGAHILPVYDALNDSGIQVVLAKHEQGAAFMAGGYARAAGSQSGRIGACIATAGPGATNLITGIANAYAERLPLLVITGETPTHIFGKGGLQESSGEGGSIDQVALFKGITRYAKTVERTEYLAQVFNQAAQVLRSAQPAPVLLSLPFDVQKEAVDADILDQISTRPRRPRLHFHPSQLRELHALLGKAERPVILAGHGCLAAGAEQQLRQLSQSQGIPVATSLKGKGVVAENSPLALGTLGVTSGGLAYEYISRSADLLLIIGAGFNERTSYVWDQKLLAGKRIIQIDQNPMQLEKVFSADLAINADIGELLQALLADLGRRAQPEPRIRRAKQELAQLRQHVDAGYSLFQSGFSLVEQLFSRLAERFPANTRLFDDNIIFAQNFFPVSADNRYYPNSGISSLGHAIPAAIGAQFERKQPTFAVIGDGGFQMCCMELMTAVNYRIPLNVILFNNATMGLIRKNQRQHYGGRFLSCDFSNPDFELLARSFGIQHRRVAEAADLDGLFGELDLEQGINLIEVMIDKNAYPNYSSKR